MICELVILCRSVLLCAFSASVWFPGLTLGISIHDIHLQSRSLLAQHIIILIYVGHRHFTVLLNLESQDDVMQFSILELLYLAIMIIIPPTGSSEPDMQT